MEIVENAAAADHVPLPHVPADETIDQRLARGPPEWQALFHEMHGLESEHVLRTWQRLKANKRQREERFGNGDGFPLAWPLEYRFLQPRDGSAWYDAVVASYYFGHDHDSVPDRVRRDLLDERMALMSTAEERSALWKRAAWSMAAALHCPPQRERQTTAEFRRPSAYYQLQRPEHDDIPERMRPDFFRPGAPAPDKFPHDGRYVVRVPTNWLFPELLQHAPLPFPLGPGSSVPEASELTVSLDDLVARDPAQWEELERAAIGTSQSDRHALLNDVYRASLGEDGDAGIVLPASLGHAAADELLLRERHAGTAPYAAVDVERLQTWVAYRDTTTRLRLEAVEKELRLGGYPGFLHPTRMEQTLQRLTELERRMRVAESPEDMARLSSEYLAAQQVAGSGSLMGDSRLTSEREGAKRSAELMKEAEPHLRNAGRVGQLPRDFFEKSDQLKLAAINLGLLHELEVTTRNRVSEAAYREALRAHYEQRCEVSWRILQESTVEAAAYLRMRRALRAMLLAAPLSGRQPTVPVINDSLFDTMIVDVTARLCHPFKIAVKNQRMVMMLFVGVKAHLYRPDLFSGDVLFNGLLLGKGASGKSYAIKLMQLTHLEGSVVNMAHMTPMAMVTGGACLSFREVMVN